MTPQLIIVMGVTGCGKSTLADRLAKHYQVPLVEADDYHSDHAKFVMSKGIGLTDSERIPWLDKVKSACLSKMHTHSPVVLSCSLLKQTYRERFRQHTFASTFIWPNTPKSLIIERLKHRTGHFAPATLLDSQFQALESPTKEKDCFEINGTKSAEHQFTASLAILNARLETNTNETR